MYGVMGADESSTTSAYPAVPLGAPDHVTGGVTGRAARQVYSAGRMFWLNASLLTVITRGATAVPDRRKPHPVSGRPARAVQAASAAARRKFTIACRS